MARILSAIPLVLLLAPLGSLHAAEAVVPAERQTPAPLHLRKTTLKRHFAFMVKWV
ncbi:hypothetical protein ACSPAH_12095 [Buttiauxella agrestis]